MARDRALSTDWKNLISSGYMSGSTGKKHPGFHLYERPTIRTVADATYTGEWDALGFAGIGCFVFPNGVVYSGHFKDSMFHGDGTLTYPMGQMIEGTWVDGHLTKWKFKFADGVEYSEPWKYCQFPDRRFFVEMKNDLESTCHAVLTNRQPTRKIPFGFYDIEEGFFNAYTKCVISVVNRNRILRIPTAAEEKWITRNCRRGWDEPTGYKPELYEVWTSGRLASISSFTSIPRNVVEETASTSSTSSTTKTFSTEVDTNTTTDKSTDQELHVTPASATDDKISSSARQKSEEEEEKKTEGEEEEEEGD